MRISDWSSDVCASDLLITCNLDSQRVARGGLILPREQVDGGNSDTHQNQHRNQSPDHFNQCIVRRLRRLGIGRPPITEDHPEEKHENANRNQGDARHKDAIMHPARIFAIFRELLLESDLRSEEHTSELQSLMRTSYAVF